MTEPATVTELRERTRAVLAEWRAAGRFVPRADSWLRSFDLDFTRRLAEEGLIGITMPKAYGGQQRTFVDRLAVTEELLRAGAPVAAHWIADRQIAPAVLRHGSEELRREIIPPIARGEAVFCLGMSEPAAGSDLARVSTRAQPVAGGWMLTGHKIWTSHAHRATHAYVLARTSDAERKHQGLSEFIVDMGSPGVTVDPIVDLAGEHHFNEVRFEGVFVPAYRLLGEEGRGWSQIVEQLAFERGGPERVLSSYLVLEALVTESRRRADASLDETVGELVARLAALRRMCVDVARAVDDGGAPVQEAASLKYLGNAFEMDVIEAGRRLGLGVVPAASLLGDAELASPAFGLRGGASDILLSIVAKQEARA
ncbi:acyl-CoA dehydrogenase family protein [Microbacterium sp. RD1]|uniref:acyl-CoA dehydrogenase family protein n=1 Tax=Microbacterium sp. RD1 TaxID=3457313 RepID=UPI003FA5884E